MATRVSRTSTRRTTSSSTPPSPTPPSPATAAYGRQVCAGLRDALKRNQPERIAIYARSLHELATTPDGIAALLADLAAAAAEDAPTLIGTVAGKAARLAGFLS